MSRIDVSRKHDLCLQCQECCKILAVPSRYPPDYKEALEFYERKGCTVFNAGGTLVIAVEHRCPELTAFGCRSYKDRPAWCRQYDGRRDPLMAEKCLWPKEK